MQVIGYGLENVSIVNNLWVAAYTCLVEWNFNFLQKEEVPLYSESKSFNEPKFLPQLNRHTRRYTYVCGFSSSSFKWAKQKTETQKPTCYSDHRGLIAAENKSDFL